MKKIIIISITVFLILVGVSGFSYQKYNSIQHDKKVALQQKKLKKLKEAQKVYNTAITDFQVNSYTLYEKSSSLLASYSHAWNLGIGSDNMALFVSTEQDINKANIEQMNGSFSKLQDTLKTISKAANEQSKKYSEAYNECKKQYTTLSAIMEQVNQPTGSYITFNQNVNELLQDFDAQNNIIKMLVGDNSNL